ncbi:hypothetical protein H2201_002400 [Coniosporium apollinis]|uniref:Allergen n=2 Tax=Coniosporium TaxID=2810619 RepID=A0ABQ9NYS7_9PEZI|nr:hypothetical protein H2199_001835 [Cladosporium sp. JES 115]KAJ9667531.1 hypothetical protein H2201_002400 [Coniosporium apollinis]
MDKARQAVSDFMAKAGHHDTTVHEKVAPAVVHETINPHRHEEVQTAIDKEIHQDHYHTSVQPVFDKEVLPETHQHNLAAVQHRTFEHGNDRDVAARLEAEAAQFTNKREIAPTRETRATAPTIAGEHIHHHVHETIQPIVQKETIQPTVVHTTIPIHEVHHNAAQYHTTSALPAVSMADFKKQGGVLTGREERYDGFEGEPRSVGGALTGHHHGTTGAAAGVGAGAGAAGLGRTRSGSSSSSSSESDGAGGRRSKRTRLPRIGGHRNKGTTGSTGTGLTGSSGTNDNHKPSLLDKLNPRKDADGDGKPGFMR